MKSGNNLFLDKRNIRIIDTFRIIYFLTFLFFFGLTEIGRNIYRPYIYENQINDYGLADSIGNLGGIIVQIFFGHTILNSTRKKGIWLTAFFVLGYILYEIAQPYLPRGVFDWRDIIGTFIGGFIGFQLFLLMHKAVKRNKVIYRF